MSCSSPTSAETTEFEHNIKLQLLKHPSILSEMQLVVQKRIRLQQRPTTQPSSAQGQAGTTAPCLFVILPKLVRSGSTAEIDTSTTTTTTDTSGQPVKQSEGHAVSQDEYRLYFLCDYSDHDHIQQEEHMDHITGTQSRGVGAIVAQGQTQGGNQGTDTGRDDAKMEVEQGRTRGAEGRHAHAGTAGHFTPSTPTSPFTTHSGSTATPANSAKSTNQTAGLAPLRIHVCEPEHGYSLKDLEDFCQVHKMSLLSLLRTLQSSLLLEPEFEQQEQEQMTHQQLQRPEVEQGQGHDLHVRQGEDERMQVDDEDKEGADDSVYRDKVKGAKVQIQDMSHDSCGDMDITEDSYYSHRGLSTGHSSFTLSRPSSPPPPPPTQPAFTPFPSSSLPPSQLFLRKRIDIAIRYLLRYFSLADLECILQTPSDTTDMQDYDEVFLPKLHAEDFAESDMERIEAVTTSDGRIVGPLNQRNTTAIGKSDDNTSASETTKVVGVVQWLCSHHFQVHCMSEARDKMKAVIHKNGGYCIEQERSTEIFFATRERAQEFYALMRQYRCVAKLNVHLGWEDLDENDLWELAEVVTTSNVSDLALDCRGKIEGIVITEVGVGIVERIAIEQLHQQRQQLQFPQKLYSRKPISFKPLLGLFFSPSLVSLTLDNFLGSLPVITKSSFKSSLNNTFSLKTYRETAEIAVPMHSHIRRLVMDRTGPELRVDYLLELFRHCPQLSDIQVECEVIDTALPMISDVTLEYDKVTFLRLTENAWENADLYFGKPSNNIHAVGSIITAINRKTLRPPSLNLQACCVAENLTTHRFLDILGKHQGTFNKLLANNPRLVSMELMCETPIMDRVWRFLMAHFQYYQYVFHEKLRTSGSEIQHSTLTFPPIPPEELAALDESSIQTLTAEIPSKGATFFLRLRLNDVNCSLMSINTTMNALVLHAYTPQQRLILRSVEDITNVLCISSSFESADQLALLQSHLEEDGSLFRFNHMIWILSPERIEDVEFLQQLRSIIRCRKLYRLNRAGRSGRGGGGSDDYEDRMNDGMDEEETIRFTVRVYAPLFDISKMIRVWNMLVDTAWLNEEEHGRWMRTCLDHEETCTANHDGKDGTHHHGPVKDESPDYLARRAKTGKKDLDKEGLGYSRTGPFSASTQPHIAPTVSGRFSSHAMTQSYTLPLDEDRELTLSSGHVFTSCSLETSSIVASNNTALAYSLTISNNLSNRQ